jgi:hypothetical protein
VIGAPADYRLRPFVDSNKGNLALPLFLSRALFNTRVIHYLPTKMAFRRTVAAIAALSSIVVPSAALDVDLKTNVAVYWVRDFPFPLAFRHPFLPFH